MNRSIYRMLCRTYNGKVPKTDREYETALKETFSEIPGEELTAYMDVVKKAMFSTSHMEEAELAVASKLYDTLMGKK